MFVRTVVLRETTRQRRADLAFLEFLAAGDGGSLALGTARAGRLAVEANQRELLAAEAGRASGQDNPWQRKKATAARDRADAALFAALREPVDSAGTPTYTARKSAGRGGP